MALWLQLRADDRPPHVVSVLMQELSTNEETEWVEHLVGEMVDGVGHLRNSADAMHILKESLALPCLEEKFVEDQLGVSLTCSQVLCQVLRYGPDLLSLAMSSCHAFLRVPTPVG